MAVITENPPREAQIVNPETGIAIEQFFIWCTLLTDLLQSGFTGTITTAPLTGGGATGSMTFQNGVLIDQILAT